MRDIPQLAIDFVKGAEACKLTAYQDRAGIWTVGYGHTAKNVVQGIVITAEQAAAYLRVDLDHARARAYRVLDEETILALSAHQWAALLSFIFNTGADPKWSLWKVFKARQFDAVPSKLMQFTHAHVDGKLVEVKGLVNRRAAEVTLWSTADAQAAVAVAQAAPVQPPPASFTRDASTPPVVAVKPAAQSKSILAACGAALCSAPGVLSKANDAVASAMGAAQPYADKSTVIAHLISNMALVGGVLAIATAGLVFLKKARETQG